MGTNGVTEHSLNEDLQDITMTTPKDTTPPKTEPAASKSGSSEAAGNSRDADKKDNPTAEKNKNGGN